MSRIFVVQTFARRVALGGCVVLLVLISGRRPSADAASCNATFGAGSFVGGECQVSGPLTLTGTVVVNETLHLLPGGVITVASPSLTLNIKGSLVMEAGSLIDGGDRTCFGPNTTAYPITVNADGSIDVKGPSGATPGGIIRANGCSGAAIVLNAAGTANIDGTVESVGTASGSGTANSASNPPVGGTQIPGGGPITIKASCSLTISDTGLVSSRGQDPGADLVHLEACSVTVYGKVESTGPGHATPGNPPNSCSNVVPHAGSVRRNPATRPDKPTNSTACVEIWADRVTIDSTGTHHGEVNADIGQSGDATGRSWIDIYATTKVTITDGAGNNHKTPVGGVTGGVDTTFAVHANQFKSNGTSSIAGLVTIKSMEGDAEGSGDVAQADDTAGLAKGGTVTFHAFSNVNLNGGTIFARGDFAESGGYGVGGKILVRAFNGTLSWGNGVADARPIGTDTVGTMLPAANRGVITLQDALAPPLVDVSTLVVPSNNNPVSSSVAGFSVLADAVGTITKPDYVDLPPATCALSCQPQALKRGIKYHDLNRDGVRNGSPQEPVLSNWEIHLFGQPMVNGLPVGPPIHLHDFTDGSGKYEFTVPAGDYTVCETQQPSWHQTQPAAGADCSAHGGGEGYAVTLTPGQVDEGNDFGNWFDPGIVVCPEDPKAVLTRTVAPGTLGGLPNHTSLQAAYDAAANGEVIGIFGKFTENVILGDHDGIEGDKTLKITQCTSAQFTAADNSKPVFDITSTGNLTIVSPDSVGGSIGWLIETDGHHLKSIRANNAIGEGVVVLGSNNEISWNNIGGNGAAGMRVEGSGNDLRGGTVDNNTGDGVVFGVAATNNSLQGATIQLNGGNGVSVAGFGNTIKSNGRLNQNGLSGLTASGADNTIQSNTAEQNGAAGFATTGPGNYLQDNKSSKNSGIGFDIAGGTSLKPNRLKGNASNNGSSGGSSENAGAEFQLFAYVKSDSGGNKADGVSIPKTAAPLKCSLFPATNATKSFGAVYACGDGID